MKHCKKCGRDVSNYQWWYGMNMCRVCGGREVYRKKKKEMKNG